MCCAYLAYVVNRNFLNLHEPSDQISMTMLYSAKYKMHFTNLNSCDECYFSCDKFRVWKTFTYR